MADLRLSVVSHGQADLVSQVLFDLAALPQSMAVSVTGNCPDSLPVQKSTPSFCDWVENPTPKGFGANHNAVFAYADESVFGVINPDLRFTQNPFPELLKALAMPDVGVVAPIVRAPNGEVEDNARHFPGLGDLTAKALGRSDGRVCLAGTAPQPVDWVGGMCMLFKREAFAAVGGFDEGFYLYYEDVDICARLWRAGWRVLLAPMAEVVHDAQRASRRDWAYRRWHLASMMRYFIKHWGRLP